MPSPITLSRYETNVDRAIAEWLQSPTFKRFLPIPNLLGCAPDGSISAEELTLRPPLAEREDIVSEAWRRLLEHHADSTAAGATVERYMLAGLLENNRWRRSAATERGASALVLVVARFLGGLERSWTRSLAPSELQAQKRIVRELQPFLNTWLSPTTPTHYNQRTFLVRVFGEAWCSLVFDSSQGNYFGRIRRQANPTLVPGVVPGHATPEAVPLPSLDII